MKSVFFKLVSVLSLFLITSSCKNSPKPVPINTAVVETKALSPETELQLNGAVASQVVLDNGLKVILISSPTSKKASAAVGVQVGSYDNPAEAQGLAHFLEHMLFLGTKEFPKVGEYQQFLTENGGGSNAYTSGNHTNYFFDVRAEKLDEALNRLSRFFVNPLFDPEFVEKEKSAIHNEFNLRREGRRSWRTLSAFLKPQAQFRTFDVGNSVSLEAATPKDTKKMFDENYYSENMHAVISGPQTVKVLRDLAVKHLSDIRSDPDKKPNTYDKVLPIDLDLLPAKVNYESKDGSKEVSMYIPVSQPKYDRSNLGDILDSLLGDESPTSLAVFLQKNGLARPGAGAVSAAAYFSGVSLTVKLTDEGLKNLNQVTNYILGYLEFLKDEPFPDFLNAEGARLGEAQKIATSYYDIGSDVTQDVNREYFSEERDFESWQELFIGKKQIFAKEKAYRSYLSRLMPEKIFLRVQSPDYKSLDYAYVKLDDLEIGGVRVKDIGDKKAVVDSFYEFAYEIEDVDTAKFEPQGEFVMKNQNPYIPSSFEVLKDGESPEFDKNEGEWGVVFTTDIENSVLPKSFLSLEIMSGQVDFENKIDVASLFLLREMLRLQTSSKSYPMVAAGFEISLPIYIDKGAIGLVFNGWSDTFVQAFEDILAFTNLEVSREVFEELLLFYKSQIQREALGAVGGIGQREMLSGVTPSHLSYEDLFSSLEKIDYESYKLFVERFFGDLHLRGALSGNIESSSLGKIVKAVEEKWSPSWAAQNSWSSLYALESLVSTYPSDEGFLKLKTVEGTSPNNVLYNAFWSFGKFDSFEDKFSAQILGQWLSPDYYKELRTKQELAYSLYAVPWNFMGHSGLRLNLLSSTADVDKVESAVETFIEKWAKEDLPLKTQPLLDGAIENILLSREVPISPAARHRFYFNLAQDDYVNIEDFYTDTEELKNLNLESVVAFGQKVLVERGKSGSFVKVTKKKEELILAP